MNQPLRTSSVEYYLKRKRFGKVGLTGRSLEDKEVLEVGCGSGIWTEALLKQYGLKGIHAFDIDPKMVDLASKDGLTGRFFGIQRTTGLVRKNLSLN